MSDLTLPFPRLRRCSWWLFVGVVLVLSAGPANAGSWTGTLPDGSVVKVDPGSRRAMRYHGGGVAPLWDGAHRLEDGSVVIVRDGQAVPTESMMNTWAAEPGSEPAMLTRYCDQLVRRACGFEDECARSQPCVLARQLLRMEGEQQRRAPVGAGVRPFTPSSHECREALANPAFPACASATFRTQDTACTRLADRVCGPDGECNASKACDPARQLVKMESEERMLSADPQARTATGVECEKAMSNAFFEPCP